MKDKNDAGRSERNGHALPPLGGQEHGVARDPFDDVLEERQNAWLDGQRMSTKEWLRLHPIVGAIQLNYAALVYQEFILRQADGEAPEWESYFEEFPELTELLDKLRRAGEIVDLTLPKHMVNKLTGKFADYELLEEIGRGGMGVVYKARQISLDRVVALKLLLSGPLSSPEEVERFQNEARTAARLKHPNIVSVHQIGEFQCQYYFAMDYVEGKSLAEGIREYLLAPGRAAEIVARIAEAVHYAHSEGVLHRDLKPDNILMDGSGQVRITDFGLARRHADNAGLTKTGYIIGSPGYMAPEQVQGKSHELTSACDVYALGAILYELLTGRPPIRGENLIATIHLTLQQEPQAVRRLQPDVPRDLETICLKCLEKEPDKRYRSAADLAADLHRFINGEPIRARPVKPVGRLVRWCRRKPVVAGLIAALIGTTLVGIVGILMGWWLTSKALHAEKIANERAEQSLAKADQARQEAEENYNRLDQLFEELIKVNEDPSRTTPAATRKSQVDTFLWAEAQSLSYPKQPTADGRALNRLASIYAKLGSLELTERRLEEAIDHCQKAIAIWQGLDAGNGPRDFERRLRLSQCYHTLSGILGQMGRTERAYELIVHSYDLIRPLAKEQPTVELRMELVGIRDALCEYLFRLGRKEESRKLLEVNLPLLEELVAENPQHLLAWQTLAGTYDNSVQKFGSGMSDAQFIRRACQVQERFQKLLRAKPESPWNTFLLARSFFQLGRLQPTASHYVDAGNGFDRAAKAYEVLHAEDPTNRHHFYILNECYTCLIECHRMAGRNSDALQVAERQLTLWRGQAKRTPADLEVSKVVCAF